MQEQKRNLKLNWTGERYLPELKGNIQLEHLHRYALAYEYVKDKKVLDMACGEGYGSMLLSCAASHVTGVDISEEVVEFAKNKYQKDNLEFKTGECAKIPMEDSSVDVVVSFETIEHHDQHEVMMKEIKRVLKKDGILIISSPDKHEYSDIPLQNNPFHKKELYHDEFKSLLENYFNNIAIYGQRIIYGSSIFPEKDKSQTVTYDMEKVTQNSIEQSRSIGMARPLYFVAFASDATLPSTIGSILEEPVTESETFTKFYKNYEKQVLEIEKQKELIIINYRNELYNVYTSHSWRYTAPLRRLGGIVRRGLKFLHK